MNFKEATDAILSRISHKQLAESLGVSVALVRQARLPETARAFRAPPKEWTNAVIRLAERRIMHYRKLIDRLRADGERP